MSINKRWNICTRPFYEQVLNGGLFPIENTLLKIIKISWLMNKKSMKIDK